MDHYKFCRLCLCGGSYLVDIFEDDNQLGFVVEETIHDLLQFKVVKTAGMPWIACSTCLNQLIEFKIFKRRCIESKTTFEDRIKQMEFLSYNLANSQHHVQQVSMKTEKSDNDCSGGVVESCRIDDTSKCYLEDLRNPGGLNHRVASDKIWYTYGLGVASVRDESMQDPNENCGMSDGSTVASVINEIDIDEMDMSHLKTEPLEMEGGEMEEHAQVESRYNGNHYEAVSKNISMSGQQGDGVDSSAVGMEPVVTNESLSLKEKFGKFKSKVKEFSCDVCGKAYFWKKRLETHLISHKLENSLARKTDRLSHKTRVNYAVLHLGKDRKNKVCSGVGENEKYHSLDHNKLKTGSFEVHLGRPPRCYPTKKTSNTTTKGNPVKNVEYKISNECDIWGTGKSGDRPGNPTMGDSSSTDADDESHCDGTSILLAEPDVGQVCKVKKKPGRPRKRGGFKKHHGRPPQGKTSNTMTRENSVINVGYRTSNEYYLRGTSICDDRPGNPTVAVSMDDSSSTAESGCDCTKILLAEPNVGQVCKVKKKPGRPRKYFPQNIASSLITTDSKVMECRDSPPKEHQPRKISRPKKHHGRYPKCIPLKIPFITNTSNELTLECHGGLPFGNIRMLGRFKKSFGKPPRPLKLSSDISVLDEPGHKSQDRVPHEIERRKVGMIRKRPGRPPSCVPMKFFSGVNATHEHGKGFLKEYELTKEGMLKRGPGRPRKLIPFKVSVSTSTAGEPVF